MEKYVLILVLIFTYGRSYAQQSVYVPERSGFLIGGMAGIGVLSLNDDVTNTSDGIDISLPNLKFGVMINPNMAILVTNLGISYEEGDDDRSFDGFVPSIQYWVKPNWWISGGFGLAMDSPAFYEKQDDYHFGTACQFSAGYELYKKGNFTIDIQSTLFAGRVDTGSDHREAVSFLTGLGFNLY